MSVWHAINGASKYVAAIAAGDLADAPTMAYRASVCKGCTRRRDYTVPLLAASAAFCGHAFQVTETTCGCLVLAGGKAAGKLCVGSEKCPSGLW